MFIFLNPGSEVKVSEGRPLASSFEIGTPVSCRPYLMMKTADKAWDQCVAAGTPFFFKQYSSKDKKCIV